MQDCGLTSSGSEMSERDRSDRSSLTREVTRPGRLSCVESESVRFSTLMSGFEGGTEEFVTVLDMTVAMGEVLKHALAESIAPAIGIQTLGL